MNTNVFKKIKFWFFEIQNWWQETQKRGVMLIYFYPNENRIECVDTCSHKIPPFCGKFSPELFQEIKKWCFDESEGGYRTRIYIWAGMEKKHLAYCEPADNYFAKPELLLTGQGFHFGSGMRYGDREKTKCPTCKKPL